MAILKIAQIGHPVLRQPARELTLDEIKSESIQRLVDDMIETMRDANGAGIAANQVFQPVRICVVEVRGNNPRYPYKPEIPLTVLINPIIVPSGTEMFSNYEGCLSVPNIRGVVKRATQITLTYRDRTGKPFSAVVEGISAGTFQHECDHLDGKLFIDKVEDAGTLCSWENFDKFYKNAFVTAISEMVERNRLRVEEI
ncbi:MAG: peptide deformylase [Myxococcales bacterium]|nr:peptide deformylase [Myxococcales bacterium]